MKTREEYVSKFKKFGIEVNRVDDFILTGSLSSIIYLN